MVKNKTKMLKAIKYILFAAVAGLLIYNSIYIQKLSDRQNRAGNKFDVAGFSQKIWLEKMPRVIDSAIDLSTLIAEVAVDKDGALSKHTYALAIGNYRYALVKVQAIVKTVKDDEVLLEIQNNDTLLNITLATEYIYGNAIRDASGLIDIKDFPNTADLNSVSEEMNKYVRTTVVPTFKKVIKNADRINVVAAIELNKQHIDWNGIELLPVKLQIVQ